MSIKCMDSNYRVHVTVNSLTKTDLNTFSGYIFVFSMASMVIMALVLGASFCERSKYNRIYALLLDNE